MTRSGARAAHRHWRFPCRGSSASPPGRACGRASATRRAHARARADPRRSPGARAAERRGALRQRDCVREIVDVLGRAREMDELRDAREFRHVGEAFLQPVLDRLDVVIGRALDGLDARRIGRRERRGDGRDVRLRRGGKRRHFNDRGLRSQRLQPCQLDPDALTNQREFAELIAQRIDLARVAAIEWRQCGKAGVFGGVHVASRPGEFITRAVRGRPANRCRTDARMQRPTARALRTIALQSSSPPRSNPRLAAVPML